MNPFLRFGVGRRCRSPPWNDETPVRDELFGVDRLEQHAESLAAAQGVTTTPPKVLSLHTRLIVLIENLRRLIDQITAGRRVRADAEALANRLLASGCDRSALETYISTRSPGLLSEGFAAELAKRLGDRDPRTNPALGWLEERLRLQGASVDEVVHRVQQRQGASNVSVRNVITSMRLISDIDWMVLSGAADPPRAAVAMASLEKHLIRRDDGLVLLFSPPFEKTPLDPGYIKGYPPGLRENGGQYSHAAMWVILAFAKLGEAEKAVELFALINPINHARTREEVDRYKVEPYVAAADVYSVSPHTGRGGWTWYTGAAGWMYRAGVEGILGIRREGNFLIVDPHIPAAWPGFEAAVKVEATHYAIVVENSSQYCRDGFHAALDGAPIDVDEEPVRVPLDGGTHNLLISANLRGGGR